MPSSKTWPHDDRPDYIIRNERLLRATEDHAHRSLPASIVALQLLAEHYAGLASMKELKRVLDDYVDGVKP